MIAAACTAAQQADATVIVAGLGMNWVKLVSDPYNYSLDESQESEGHDRTILSWPGVQVRETMMLLLLTIY